MICFPLCLTKPKGESLHVYNTLWKITKQYISIDALSQNVLLVLPAGYLLHSHAFVYSLYNRLMIYDTLGLFKGKSKPTYFTLVYYQRTCNTFLLQIVETLKGRKIWLLRKKKKDIENSNSRLLISISYTYYNWKKYICSRKKGN